MKYIQELISKRYSKLGEIDIITGVQAHEINSKNSILRCRNSETKYICKIIGKDARINEILKILKHCRSEKQKVSKVIINDLGNSLNELEDTYLYVLLYEEGDIFTGDIKEVKSLASNLASLHQALDGYKDDVPQVKKHDNYLPLSGEEFRQIHNKINQKRKKSSFDELVLEKMSFITNNLVENQNYFMGLNKQTLYKQIIHGDLTVMNVMFLNKKLQIFLDFNHAHYDDRIREVAFACMRYSLHNTNDKVLIKKRIQTFVKEYDLSNPLSDLEKQALEQYYINECLRKVSYILRSNYFYNDSKWNFDLKKHIDNIERTISLRI